MLYFLLIKPALKYLSSIRKETYFKAAIKVGANFPEVKDELINTMQLVSENEKENLYSENLIDAAFKKVYERIKNLNFQSLDKF